MITAYKYGVASLSGLLFLIVVVFPIQTRAQLTTFDPIDFVYDTATNLAVAGGYNKDFILDPISWIVAKTVLHSLSQSVVNWINSGFQGSPAFVTDLEDTLMVVGDTAAVAFIAQLSVTALDAVDGVIEDISSPFQDGIAATILDEYFRATSPQAFAERNRYSLRQYTKNDRLFLQGNFQQGGWNAWFGALDPRNNPYGYEIIITGELQKRVAEARSERLVEIDWGNGFISWRGECMKSSVDPFADPAAEGETDLSEEDECAEYAIETPGSVIADGLSQAMGTTYDELGVADEFNEIASALFVQLTKSILGSTGLSGVSRPAPGGGPRPIDAATNNENANTNIKSRFVQMVDDQITKIKQYEAAWKKIQNIALQAEAKADSCNVSEQEKSLISSALSDAESALSRAESSTVLLTNFGTSAKSNTADIVTLSAEYETLMGSNSLVQGGEINSAIADSQSISSGGGETLYMQLSDIVSRSCIRGSDD